MEYEILFLGSLTLIYLLALLYWVFLKEFITGLNFNSFGQVKKFYTRIYSYGDVNLVGNGKSSSSLFRSVNGIIAIGCSLIFFLVLVGAYWLLSRDLQPNSSDQGFSIPGPNDATGKCNVFDGKWIPDDSYPLYNASDCPFAEIGFNCLANGRKDEGFLKWRWKPKSCDLPRFDVQELLKYLRGKRVVFVGDSLTRTQWESFICMLMSGVEDKRFVYEVNQNKISKKIRFLNVRFDTYNFTVEFYRSVFLSWLTPPPKRAPKRVKWTVRLDKMDNVNEEWVDADVLIFNTGHWWTKTKLFETVKLNSFEFEKNLKATPKDHVALLGMDFVACLLQIFYRLASMDDDGVESSLFDKEKETEATSPAWLYCRKCTEFLVIESPLGIEYRGISADIRGTYFQVGKTLKLGMPVTKALTKALETWASWVESRINHNRTHVFFRTFESSHWSGRNRNTCKVTRRPMLTAQGRDKSPISDVILKVIKSMSAPVTALHVTPMGAYRSDAHVGTWSDNPSVPDCSHWCLPGLPDMWNEIIFTYLLHKDQLSQQQTVN